MEFRTLEEYDGIPGWYSCPDFWRFIIDELPEKEKSRIALVGALFGADSNGIMKIVQESGKEIHLTIIDAFDKAYLSYPAQKICKTYGGFREAFDHFRSGKAHDSWLCEIITGTSPKIANHFPDSSFDVVFLDNTHERNHIDQEITAWTPKIKGNGYISGKYAGIINNQFIEHPEVIAALKNREYSKIQTAWYIKRKQ